MPLQIWLFSRLDPEPFGRTAVEAQAATLPVIVSDAGGFRETVREDDALYDSDTIVQAGVCCQVMWMPSLTNCKL